MGDELAFNETTSFSHPNKQGDAQDTKPKSKTPERNNSADTASAAVGIKGSVKLEDGIGGAVATGDAGFSRRMLLNTSDVANSLGGWNDVQLRHVLPATAMAEWQIRQRTREHQQQLDMVSGRFMGTTRGSVTADTAYQKAADFCLQHATQITSDVNDENQKSLAYNAWVPRANSYFSSLMRLRAQEEMLGVKDTRSLVQQLLKGVGDMSQVAARMQIAGDRGNAQTLQLPVVDGTLTEASEQTTSAGKLMRAEYLGFQQHLLAVQKDATYHEGDKDTARLAQINENKELVRNVGTTIDAAMSALDGAPAAVATATTRMNKFGATIGAAANKKQIMSGMRQTHNPTYLAIDAHGNQVVRNVQIGTDRAIVTKPGDPYSHAPTPEAEGPTLPTNVGELMGKIVDFAYADEVKKINFHLETIKTRCEIIQSVSDAIATKKLIQTFQNAMNDFALKCAELQKRMEARRQQYLDFGVQLDTFARTDHGSQKAGLAPGKGGERYASIMSMVSTVREVLSMGRGAKSGFESTSDLATWTQGVFERRERTDDGRKDISFMQMPGDELQRMVDMHQQVQVFEHSYDRETSQLAPVDAAAQQAMGALHQGSGGSVSGGLY